MKKMKIGIIGAGMIGDVHINNILKDGRGEVIWIATQTEKTLKEKLNKHHIQKGTTRYQEILEDSSINAVVIASPPFTHLEMVKNALDSGKHILLEKPMVANRKDLEDIIRIVESHPDLLVLECSCRHARLQPKFNFIKSIIDKGQIGEVYHIHHNHLMRSTFIEYNPRGRWALLSEKGGGGPFIDWGVYDLSFHLGILNDLPEIRTIQSFTKNGLKVFQDPGIVSDIEEHGAAFMTFSEGLTYYYERGSGVHFEESNETRIFGTKGALRFAFCSWDSSEVDYYYIDEKNQEKHKKLQIDMSQHSDDNFELIRHFMDCLTENKEPRMTVQLAAKHLDILFRILNK